MYVGEQAISSDHFFSLIRCSWVCLCSLLFAHNDGPHFSFPTLWLLFDSVSNCIKLDILWESSEAICMHACLKFLTNFSLVFYSSYLIIILWLENSEPCQYFIWIFGGMDKLKLIDSWIQRKVTVGWRCNGSRATLLGDITFCHFRRVWNHYLSLTCWYYWTEDTAMVFSYTTHRTQIDWTYKNQTQDLRIKIKYVWIYRFI